MSEKAITVKDLSKVYHISHERQKMKGTATFRDALYGVAKKPIQLLTGRRLNKEDFWALKDIDFEVERGDVVGIIGRNGSGKSTLLKILSRIVEPTKGEIRMSGKVASLLEVGTGFHPELTGRENIFFNGAILGMKRREIISKFDEIVAFSEIEQFLDTPVKFYSSGMYVRLAFSVAAHLDPDILIVDEVLAVGDARFQKKSLGKMKSVAESGRTVLFVSHSMESVARLCNKGILLNEGSVEFAGDVYKTIRKYGQLNKSGEAVLDLTDSPSKIASRLSKVIIKNSQGRPEHLLKALEPFSVCVQFEINESNKSQEIMCAVGIQSSSGNPVRTAWAEEKKYKPGIYEACFNFDEVFLEANDYNIVVSLSLEGETVQYIEEAANLRIEEVAFREITNPPKRLAGTGIILNQPRVEIREL